MDYTITIKHDHRLINCDHIVKNMIIFVLIIYSNFSLASMIYFRTNYKTNNYN